MPAATKHTDALINDLIPTAEVKKLELGRTEEIMQPLLDLGYLKIAEKSQLEQAIRLFRKDYIDQNLMPDFAPGLIFLENDELESEELNLLHTLTALDGDFNITALPEFGICNLCSRVIHYRLSIHELYKRQIDEAFSEKSLKGLKKLRSWINNLPADQLDLINILGDVPRLLQHIQIDSNGGLNRRIVVFKYLRRPSTSLPADEVEEDETDKGSDNEKAMLRLENEIDDALDELVKDETFDSREQEALDDIARKNRKKRDRLQRIASMSQQVHQKMKDINDAIAAEGKQLSLEIKQFKQQVKELDNSIKVAGGMIRQKESFIDQLEKDKKKLRKKERVLKRKIRQGAPAVEIRKLQQEIKALKTADTRIEALQKEIDEFKKQIDRIEAELKKANKNMASRQRALDRLIDKRQEIIGERQKVLKALLDQLKRLERKVDKLRFSFKGRLRRSLDKTYFDETIKKEVFQRRNKGFLDPITRDPYNKYLIRLIQIFQWTNGFYYGRLDNKIGDRTFSALDDMVTYSKGLRLKFILSRLSENHSGTKGYWVLNVKYLFGKLADIIAEQNPDLTTCDLLEKYENEYIDSEGNAGTIGSEATDAGYREIVEENQKDIRTGSIRRIYYGIKSIASTLFNALADLVRLLKRGIKKLIYLVKNLIKIVYKEIREGVRKFRDGMAFLFGRRQFFTPTPEGSAILTKFDFDFDALTFAPPSASDLALRTHAGNLHRFSSNLDFTMVLTGRILKWAFRLIEIGTPIGWAKLAIKIAFHFKRMIIKWLIKLGRSAAQAFWKVRYVIID